MLHARATSVALSAGQALSLYVDNFDAEQIWLQLESAVPLLNRSAHRLLKDIGPEATLIDARTEQELDGV